MHALPQAIRPVTWLLFSEPRVKCHGQTGVGWDLILYFVGRDKEHLFQEVLQAERRACLSVLPSGPGQLPKLPSGRQVGDVSPRAWSTEPRPAISDY